MSDSSPLSRRDFGRMAAAAAGLSLLAPERLAGRQAQAPPLEYEPLMDFVADLGERRQVGRRRIVRVTGGTFEGPELSGRILPGGADWVRQRPDGASVLDVRVTLETDDGALIYTSYRGILYNPDDGDLYWRVTPVFETGDERYDWLTRIVTVGVGRQQPGQAAYWFYRIL